MAEKHVLEVKNKNKSAAHAPTQIKGKCMTLLRYLVNSDLPESELSTPRLVNEAQVLLGAGTIGTACVLDLTCYHILANPEIRFKVSEELRDVMLE